MLTVLHQGLGENAMKLFGKKRNGYGETQRIAFVEREWTRMLGLQDGYRVRAIRQDDNRDKRSDGKIVFQDLHIRGMTTVASFCDRFNEVYENDGLKCIIWHRLQPQGVDGRTALSTIQK